MKGQRVEAWEARALRPRTPSVLRGRLLSMPGIASLLRTASLGSVLPSNLSGRTRIPSVPSTPGSRGAPAGMVSSMLASVPGVPPLIRGKTRVRTKRFEIVLHRSCRRSLPPRRVSHSG
jgi:hypothetical protein